jgi:hypothetical protein
VLAVTELSVKAGPLSESGIAKATNITPTMAPATQPQGSDRVGARLGAVSGVAPLRLGFRRSNNLGSLQFTCQQSIREFTSRLKV